MPKSSEEVSDSDSVQVHFRSIHKTSALIKMYYDFPEEFRRNLYQLQEEFYENKEVVEMAKELYRKHEKGLKKYPKPRNIVFQLAMLSAFPARLLFMTNLYPKVIAYDQRGNFVRLENILVPKRKRDDKGKFKPLKVKHVCVMRGQLVTTGSSVEKPVVVKWYKSKNGCIDYEINIYRKLRHLGLDTPFFSSTFMMWNQPVLVIENLERLDKTDDEYQVGIAVLQQLKYIHQIGIHNDLKPGNILKRVQEDEKGITVKYFVIDYGGVATKRHKHGYIRWTWTPTWASQEHVKERDEEGRKIIHRDAQGNKIKRPKQVTTEKNDFLELGHTMKSIWGYKFPAKHQDDKLENQDDFKTHFTGRLRNYMDYVNNNVDCKNIRDEDYDNLIQILSFDS